MKIRLTPDQDILVQKMRVGRVPVPVIKPVNRLSADIGLLWLHGGGYIAGMKQMVHISRAVDLVRKYGVTVCSPGCRLAWQRHFEEALERI